jgi:hypothetical protein
MLPALTMGVLAALAEAFDRRERASVVTLAAIAGDLGLPVSERDERDGHQSIGKVLRALRAAGAVETCRRSRIVRADGEVISGRFVHVAFTAQAVADHPNRERVDFHEARERRLARLAESASSLRSVGSGEGESLRSGAGESPLWGERSSPVSSPNNGSLPERTEDPDGRASGPASSSRSSSTDTGTHSEPDGAMTAWCAEALALWNGDPERPPLDGDRIASRLHVPVTILGAGFTMRGTRALLDWRGENGVRAALKRSNLLMALRLVARDDDERASVDAFERITSKRATARKVAARWPRWEHALSMYEPARVRAYVLAALRLNPDADPVKVGDDVCLRPGGPRVFESPPESILTGGQ